MITEEKIFKALCILVHTRDRAARVWIDDKKKIFKALPLFCFVYSLNDVMFDHHYLLFSEDPKIIANVMIVIRRVWLRIYVISSNVRYAIKHKLNFRAILSITSLNYTSDMMKHAPQELGGMKNHVTQLERLD